ncbi:hypothetical protein B0T10DRAFT_609926 [Thelonectria olida]|uniref:N-acetyltransferase domain-containing protein n=1 Tax=Thelonectria olida TaxID=1576542 RepID=A0A9P8VV00_9HYPO|nr:hypothetical protein B0T10DRAFT_609926 [Thelonectria olida]
MPISVSIQPVSGADLPALADFLYTSKLSLSINRLLYKDWPNESAQRPIYAGAIKTSLSDPSSECLKAVDAKTGNVLGFVVLTKKPAQKNEDVSRTDDGAAKSSVPESMNPEVFWTVMKATAELSHGAENIDHLEVTYVFVKPSNRRIGIGSQLVRECCMRAKDAGLPLIVSSEPAGYDFFLKNGFTKSKHFDIDLRKWAPPYNGFGIFRLARLAWNA